MIKVFLSTLIISLSFTAETQVPIKVQLNELKEELVKNNLDIKLSKRKIDYTHENYRMASNYLLPEVLFNATISSTNIPLHAFGTRLQQSRIAETDFNPEILNHPQSIQNFQASINVVQPVLNLDAKNFKKSSNHSLEASKYEHKRIEEKLLYLLEDNYIQLKYSYLFKDELDSIKDRTAKIYSLVENALDAGYAYPDDLLKAKLRREQVEDQIFESELNIKSLSDKIKYLTGQTQSGILEPSETLEPDQDEDLIYSLNPSRNDLEALSYYAKASEEQTKALQNSLKPRLNVYISYEYNLFDFIEGGNGYMAGLQLSWQIFNARKSSVEIQKSKIQHIQTDLQYEKAQKESLTELNALKNQTELIKAKIETQQSAIFQSKETLRISLNRYKEGIEKTSDLIQNEIQLAQRKLELHHLHMNYQQIQNSIRFIAG